MNERQYNIVKIFTSIKLPKQLEKISKAFKIPLLEVYRVAETATFNQYKDNDDSLDFLKEMFDGYGMGGMKV